MGKKKLETMSLAEIEAQIQMLKEQRSRTAMREKEIYKKTLTHRKIQMGGVINAALADAGIDIVNYEREVFDHTIIPALQAYFRKYSMAVCRAVSTATDSTQEAARPEVDTSLFLSDIDDDSRR